MMNHRGILITFRALTHAQRGARLLERSGCPASVLRPPQELPPLLLLRLPLVPDAGAAGSSCSRESAAA